MTSNADLNKLKLFWDLTCYLAKNGDAQAHEELIHLAADENPTLRKRILEARVNEGEDSYELLTVALRDANASVRELALKLAEQFPDERLLPILAEKLADPSDALKHLASRAIRACRSDSPYLLRPVLAQLQAHDPKVRILAVEALAYEHSSQEIVDALLLAMDNGDEATRRAITPTWPYCKERAHLLEALVARLDHPKSDIAQSALWGLTAVGDRACLPHLRRFLDHPDIRFVRIAFAGLRRLGTEEDRSLLAGLRDKLRPRLVQPLQGG